MIQEGSQVSIEFTLTLDNGTTVDSNVGEDPVVYTHGQSEILPVLESALVGLAVNDEKQVTIGPEDAYGVFDPDAKQDVAIDLIPEEARQVNTMLVAKGEDGSEQPVRVAEIHDDRAVIDLNHPLAGRTLHFQVKVVGIE